MYQVLECEKYARHPNIIDNDSEACDDVCWARVAALIDPLGRAELSRVGNTDSCLYGSQFADLDTDLLGW